MIRPSARLGLLLAALALPAAAYAVPARRASARPAPVADWSTRGAITPAGAFVIGNPNAKVKLIEYFSFTCPHCAHFAAEGVPALMRDPVRTGRLSIEFRHALRDIADLSASVVARCGGPAKFVGMETAIFAGQPTWVARAQEYLQANRPAAPGADKLAPAAALDGLATASGLTAMAAAHGIPAARARACLLNPASQKPMFAMTEEALNVQHIPGTPAFLINGTIVPDASDWAHLSPAIDAALAAAK